MPTYIVAIPEVHYSYRTVEADSEEDAKIVAAESEPNDMDLEYSHTLDESLWKIEEIPEKVEIIKGYHRILEAAEYREVPDKILFVCHDNISFYLNSMSEVRQYMEPDRYSYEMHIHPGNRWEIHETNP